MGKMAFILKDCFISKQVRLSLYEKWFRSL